MRRRQPIFVYMSRILAFLFPSKKYSAPESRFLLALRILFGGLLMTHGFAKWSGFATLSVAFPDPLFLGTETSLLLAITAELVCSACFIVGAFYRLALLPMIFTLGIAFFVIHGGAPFASRELAFIYLTVFVLLFFRGPGLYAIDRRIGTKLRRHETEKR